jgi:hypothetical protein
MAAQSAKTLTSCEAFVCIHAVKGFASLMLIFLLAAMDSCTTLVNRRDLYSPEPGPESLEAARQWYGVTTRSTTTARSQDMGSAADVRRY